MLQHTRFAIETVSNFYSISLFELTERAAAGCNQYTKGSPTLVDYASTKGAIVAFTKSLGLQLAPRGIRVNAVAPGIIYTALQAATGGQKPETVDSIGVESAPLGRPGQPSEVGPAYVFLASHESSYTTGAVIHVTGGVEVYG